MMGRKLFRILVILAATSLLLSLVFLFQGFEPEKIPEQPSINFLAENYRKYLGSRILLTGRFVGCPALAEVMKGARTEKICFLADPDDLSSKIKVRFKSGLGGGDLTTFGSYSVRGIVESSSDFWYGAQIFIDDVQRSR